MSNHAQAEIDKLNTQYTKFLGLQNQKQKLLQFTGKLNHVFTLTGRSNHAQAEIDKLSTQCAKLLDIKCGKLS